VGSIDRAQGLAPGLFFVFHAPHSLDEINADVVALVFFVAEPEHTDGEYLSLAKGMVYLVGAGPGDPGLITVKGRACLELADVIIYDHLANQQLLAYARSDCELIARGEYGQDQDELLHLMANRARQGKTVVRLKGGTLFSLAVEEKKRSFWPRLVSPLR